MDGTTPRRNVAVFIDLENMFGGYAGDVSGVPMSRMIREIEAEIQNLGFGYKAAATRAYANWAFPGMAIYRREVLENGIEPVQIFSYEGGRGNPSDRQRKNAADIQLVVDALTVAGEAPWVDVFVIVSGDGDFVPLVRRLQYLDKFVVGVTIRNGSAGGVSSLFRSVVDHFLDIDGAVGAAGSLDEPQLDAAPALEAKAQPRASVPSNERPSEAQYVAAVQEIVASRANATKDGAVDGAVVNNILRRRWPRVTFLDFGYKTFGEFVTDACQLTIYRPTQSREREASPAAPNSDTRAALEAVAPPVTYPKLSALEDVLGVLTLQVDALPPEDVIDLVGTQLAEVPAEQVRLALSLLFSVGAFMDADGDGLVLSSDVRSVDEGKLLVVEDAKRRAATIGVSLSNDDLTRRIFPDSD